MSAVSTIHRPPMFAKVVPTVFGYIPPITEPQGQHWRQPDLTDLDISGSTVNLTQRQFDALSEYSTTTPTGVYPGKCWKAQGMAWPQNQHGTLGFPKATGIWYLRWFGEAEDPKLCTNNQRIINITT